jgi:hypothetical protein
MPRFLRLLSIEIFDKFSQPECAYKSHSFLSFSLLTFPLLFLLGDFGSLSILRFVTLASVMVEFPITANFVTEIY